MVGTDAGLGVSNALQSEDEQVNRKLCRCLQLIANVQLGKDSHTCAESSSVQTGPSGLSALSAVVPGLARRALLDFCWAVS